MGLPVGFLIGLLALFVAHEVADWIPGQGDFGTLAMVSLTLALPTMLAAAARRSIRRRYVAGRHPALDPGLMLRLSMSLSPLTVFAVSTIGGWIDLSWRLAGDSQLLGLVLTGAPLLVAELPRLVLATQVSAWLEIEGDALQSVGGPMHLPSLRELASILRLRLGWIAIVSLPWLLFGVGIDLLGLSRATYAFVLGTSFGTTIGFVVLLVMISLALPVGFRRVFGVTRAIPEPTGSELRRVARALGFDGDQVYLLPTGMSAVNAMMVGPLPWSRCLCVTDGLVHVLDAEALSGVVAHEVGHARMGHPALLVLLAVILPLMLLQPLGLLPVDDLDLAWQVLLGSFLVSVLWLIVRALAHRFELEADIASVRALGAAPCSRALSAVSNATIAVRRSLLGRLSTFHPEESTRLMTMLRYERDAGFRSRFDATGRRLRVVILAAVSVAAVLAGIAWSLDWTYQRAIWHFHAGDFVAARAARQAIGDEVPDRWRDSWERVGSELDAAVELAPDATDWATARTTLRQRAGTRAVAELLRQGPAAATPWFALTVDVSDPADADYLLMHQLYELCRAIRDADTPRADAIRAVIRQRPIPEALAPVLR